MATFVYTWNATFLATPADVEDESLGAQRIRDTKGAVGERFVIDHKLAGDANDGKHTKVTLPNRGATSALALDAGDGAVWTANVGGTTELFYQDSLARVNQLTSNGGLNSPTVFPSNTTMLFIQAAPPPGWLLDTNINDALIRVNASVGGGTGGSWTITGLGTQAHTLQLGEIPNHTHEEQFGQGSGGGPGQAWNVTGTLGAILDLGIPTLGAGGGGPHDHGAVVADGTWRPAYIDAVIGAKI